MNIDEGDLIKISQAYGTLNDVWKVVDVRDEEVDAEQRKSGGGRHTRTFTAEEIRERSDISVNRKRESLKM